MKEFAWWFLVNVCEATVLPLCVAIFFIWIEWHHFFLQNDLQNNQWQQIAKLQKKGAKKAKSQKECISQVWFGKKLRNQMIYHLIYLTKVIVYFCLLRKITTKNHKLSTYWTWKFSSHKSSGGLDYVKEECGLKKYSRHFWNQQFDFQML